MSYDVKAEFFNKCSLVGMQLKPGDEVSMQLYWGSTSSYLS
jgi:hypothetical protein